MPCFEGVLAGKCDRAGSWSQAVGQVRIWEMQGLELAHFLVKRADGGGKDMGSHANLTSSPGKWDPSFLLHGARGEDPVREGLLHECR